MFLVQSLSYHTTLTKLATHFVLTMVFLLGSSIEGLAQGSMPVLGMRILQF